MTYSRFRGPLTWAALALVLVVPLWAAAHSPLLAWRQPVYILAGFAGIAAFGLACLQPLLAVGLVPDLPLSRSRWLHRGLGILLLASVVLHVAGLWLTSPPDVVDALLLRSPTPFSPFGVAAMWALFGVAGLAALRGRLPLRYPHWRLAHTALGVVVLVGTVAHALLIEGTMETVTKYALCGFALFSAGLALTMVRKRRKGPLNT
ncbi:ferric reductase-like transmembrane domain-containing protein [Mameliella sediminis]|uniref:ferric reductase-like transmembrane domain-containing protein n=1 Tax=Mameliella sediminis TaxID=2836866 RepID=UPI0031BAC81B